MRETYDRVIIGAGMYGLYAAVQSGRNGYSTLVIETEDEPFKRGSRVNQARLHNGYHYPRSYATAAKSQKYFDRFLNDFSDCIHTDFNKVYGIASNFSWTNGSQFKHFADNLQLVCEETDLEPYFYRSAVEKAYRTIEYSFDAQRLKAKLLGQIDPGICGFRFGTTICNVVKEDGHFIVTLDSGEQFETPYILNATYAGTNQIHDLMGYEHLPIKYELCEVIICDVSEHLKGVGITVMDGPFFSIMPFGFTGYHSLTTVSNTPHYTSHDSLPAFPCQEEGGRCSPGHLRSCNQCKHKPETAFVEMNQMVKKYLKSDIVIRYVESLYTVKPVLKTSEVDDSRPTVIRQYSQNPEFYTVFSGKINTVYDLDDILR
ncbi:FAD-dependent oxidoreductase [Paenibacillus piri]|uniref:FAD-binding oxidoreductase n=1 Tax=Paenibacillus piri TaxID=2547395 RepID=A0A4R5KM77_9BACL|nr:FAD-dependent oxidoreductase [Paenibacillus piri]TDF96332.1 FAD-binding oxidoreductase [Paenibacillus piri]